MSTNPLEIVVGPLSLYVAPVGEAFPLIDDTPAGNWALVGTSGDKSYDDDGVTVNHEQNIEEIFGAGSTGPLKAVRTSERLTIAVKLMDLTLDEYTRAINNVTPTDVAAGGGEAGTRAIQLRRGANVVEFALLAKGLEASPELATSPAQYEVPRVYVGGEPSLSYVKGGAAMLEMEFIALEDPAASTDAERFGQVIYQHQTAV